MISSGGEGRSNAADIRRDVEQIFLAGRGLPEDDGGERLPSKPVRWIERFPLQVKRSMHSFNEGTIASKRTKVAHTIHTETMVFGCGMPCTVMSRESFRLHILLNR